MTCRKKIFIHGQIKRLMLCIGCVLVSSVLFCVSPVIAGEPVQVFVRGLEGDALANVQAALTLPPGIVREGEVNVLWLELFRRDAPEKAKKALEPFGYYSPEITVSLETSDAGGYILRVTVVPGRQVRVTEVAVALQGPGAEEKALRELVAAFPLRKGDVLLHAEYEGAKGALKARAIELGYLGAEFPVHRILVSKAEADARIELTLDTGPRFYFGEASFEDGQYPESFLKRHLAFKPGEVFSHEKLHMTQLNLINSDRFSEVFLSAEKKEAVESRVPVRIRLKPAPGKRLRFGIGYGTDTGARFAVGYKDLNIFSRGHELNAELNLSERLQALAAGYIIPGRALDSFTGLQLNLKREDTKTYESSLVSLEASRTHSIGRGSLGIVYLKLQQEDSTIGTEGASSRLVLPGARFSKQRYDDLLRPTRGHRYALDVRGTDRFLGSDLGFIQILAEGNMLIPLPWRLSLLARAKGAVTFEREALSELPASLRFFAGGDRSVRGYAYQSLGPRDASGNVVGGKHLFVASLEIEKSILQDWGAAVFYDVGNSFNSLDDIGLFQGAGLGVRYYTRVGAIRLDIARQIGVDNPKVRLHFSFGFQL